MRRDRTCVKYGGSVLGKNATVRRVLVVGSSGAGKTTFARELADRLALPHVELDAIFHQPDWQELPREEFRAAVSVRIAEPGWVVDGNYSKVQDLVLARADSLVWLDYSRAVVMRRIVPRTVTRVVRRQELWNGNREPWRESVVDRPTTFGHRVVVDAPSRPPGTLRARRRRRRRTRISASSTWSRRDQPGDSSLPYATRSSDHT